MTLDSRFFALPEKARFLMVGGLNTLFSLFLFAVLFWIGSDYFHYQVILIITHIISVTTSFMGLKWLVFRSHGTVVYEYLKTHLVYLFVLGANVVCLYIFVELLAVQVILSQVLATVVIVIVSYVGSKYIAFRIA
jgi:putative flippase GtrA